MQQRPNYPLSKENPMTDFQSFRNAVLEDGELQEQFMSIIHTENTNDSGMRDG